MINLRHLEKTFPLKSGQFFALRNINLEIAEGDFVSIMGPSGSGKSTLLHILGLHDGEWKGEYDLLGHAVHQLDRKRRLDLQRQHIGFVFQSYHLLDDLTVYENIEVPLTYRNIPKRERESLDSDMLDRFQMVGKRDLFPSQLSGGQQQLVGIARALIHKPALLLADEPTGNLHSDQAREIMAQFRQLNDHGVTIVQVTHSPENAACGRRIIRLADGWIVDHP
jgi:ABC-type lipoprotein export system ATPase subunit